MFSHYDTKPSAFFPCLERGLWPELTAAAHKERELSLSCSAVEWGLENLVIWRSYLKCYFFFSWPTTSKPEKVKWELHHHARISQGSHCTITESCSPVKQGREAHGLHPLSWPSWLHEPSGPLPLPLSPDIPGASLCWLLLNLSIFDFRI